MTHTYLSSDTSHAPALPGDFAERSAYMRLYGAQLRNLPPPARETFGDEIALLVARGHVEDTRQGYTLTAAGIAHWQLQVLQWESPTEVRSLYKSQVPAPRRILLALCEQDGWVGLEELSRGRGRTHTLNVCKKMAEHGLVEAWRVDMRGAWQIRITDAGRKEAQKIAEEKAS